MFSSKPQKPRSDYPLTAHRNGQWCKWIKPKGAPRAKGRIIFFGTWADPKAAEALYRTEREEWDAGRDPRATATYAPSGVPMLEEIADRWLVKQEQLVREGALSPRSYMDKNRAVGEMFRHWSKDTDPHALRPDDFEELHRKFGEGVGPSSQGQRVIHIRAMFRWAGPENQRLMPQPPHWGDKFRNVSAAERRDARDDNEKINGERKFATEVAHAILNCLSLRESEAAALHADHSAGTPRLIAARWLLAANLIAANTGAYASDIAALAEEDVELDCLRWIDKKRVKTKRHRIKWQAPLWPETVAAIRAYRPVRPLASPSALKAWRERRAQESQAPAWRLAALKAEPIFLTAEGFPLVHELTHFRQKDGVLVKNTPIDSVGQAMGKLLLDLNAKIPGLNFGAWRHTVKTIGEEMGRDKFLKRVMGHTVGMVDESYFKPTAEQLRTVTEHLRKTLLPASLTRSDNAQVAA